MPTWCLRPQHIRYYMIHYTLNKLGVLCRYKWHEMAKECTKDCLVLNLVPCITATLKLLKAMQLVPHIDT